MTVHHYKKGFIMEKKTPWQKLKNYVKSNPDDAMFWGATTVLFTSAIAFSAWLFKLQIDADKEEYETLQKQHDWYEEQTRQGKVIMFDAFGNAVAFNPLKPLYSSED
jgi:hypothetical protein